MVEAYIHNVFGGGICSARDLFLRWSIALVKTYLGRLVMLYDDKVELSRNLQSPPCISHSSENFGSLPPGTVHRATNHRCIQYLSRECKSRVSQNRLTGVSARTALRSGLAKVDHSLRDEQVGADRLCLSSVGAAGFQTGPRPQALSQAGPKLRR